MTYNKFLDSEKWKKSDKTTRPQSNCRECRKKDIKNRKELKQKNKELSGQDLRTTEGKNMQRDAIQKKRDITNRTCNGLCKKFRVTKPTNIGRYEAGHGRCQMCDIWIDYHGAHTKDGHATTRYSEGWFCNCCNYRVRRHPRNKKYKEQLRDRISLKENVSNNFENTHDSQNEISTSDDNLVYNHNDTPNNTQYGTSEKSPLNINKINELITKSLPLIKSNPNGVYLNYLRIILKISKEEMNNLLIRLIRIDDVTKNEIKRDGKTFEILLRYNTLDRDHDTHRQIQSNQHLQNKESTNDIKYIVRHMINQYASKNQSKHLQYRLTQEYMQSGSIKDVIKNNPNFSKTEIMNHIKSANRLPAELKKLEIEGRLHFNPRCSLHIALYAVNYYEWDGEESNKDNVINLALSITKYLTENKDLNQLFAKRESA